MPLLTSTTPNGSRSAIILRTDGNRGLPAHSTTACESSADRNGPTIGCHATTRPLAFNAAKNTFLFNAIFDGTDVQDAPDTVFAIAAVRTF